MPIVVDDATLLAILTRRASEILISAAEVGDIATTGSWYYRLHRALHDPESAGSLSTMVANLSQGAKTELFATLDDLPPEIIVPGPRLLVPIMGALRLRRRVNLLAAEALATALITGSTIRVTAESPVLRAACGELGITFELLPPFE